MPVPLAARLRPKTLAEFIGQTHLVGNGKPLRLAIEQGKIHSMLFWGPPGVGKTTLAQIIARHCKAHFISLSAVMAGVKDIREAMGQAQEKAQENQSTVLFIDEIHRFNKSQQDALLPYVEDGTVVLIGATTENPSFEVNNALLSRCRIYVLKALNEQELTQVLTDALNHQNNGCGDYPAQIEDDAVKRLIVSADGDARRLLTILEVLLERFTAEKFDNKITLALVEEVLIQDCRAFDKKGEIFYEQISALHKSVRGSSPDAALYWLCRMLDGGCDPLYIARRVVRMACEDIGNAEPRGLGMALDAWDALERLGRPEGDLALAQVVVYLACAPKSNAVYTAFNAAMKDVQQQPSFEVPVHLRNAPTHMMKKMGYGKTYRYDPDEPGGFARGQTYFPDKMGEKKYYSPVNRGLEQKIAEKMQSLRDEKV